MLKLSWTDISQLSSQGLESTEDGSISWMHSTTVPAEFYEASYNIKGGCNMDRGGCGQTRNGQNFACVFDGVSAGGKVNAYAAQAFSEITLTGLGRQLMQKLDRARDEVETVTQLESLTVMGKGLFARASSSQSNPGYITAEHEAEGGAATGVFAYIQPRSQTRSGRNEVHGVAIGDAMAIQISTRRSGGGQPLAQPEARLLNTFERIGNSATDTGGQITLGIGVDGEVCPFCQTLGEEDLIILASDGLGDNIAQGEFAQIIPLIVRTAFFERFGREVADGQGGEYGLQFEAPLRRNTFVHESSGDILTAPPRGDRSSSEILNSERTSSERTSSERSFSEISADVLRSTIVPCNISSSVRGDIFETRHPTPSAAQAPHPAPALVDGASPPASPPMVKVGDQSVEKNTLTPLVQRALEVHEEMMREEMRKAAAEGEEEREEGGKRREERGGRRVHTNASPGRSPSFSLDNEHMAEGGTHFEPVVINTQTKITRYQDGWLGHSPPTVRELMEHVIIPFGKKSRARSKQSKNGSRGGESSRGYGYGSSSSDGHGLQDLRSVSCEQASVRLVGYLRWVTVQMYQEEELYYGLRARRLALVRSSV
jgi:serine/threonine protein phosphatase PrpC